MYNSYSFSPPAQGKFATAGQERQLKNAPHIICVINLPHLQESDYLPGAGPKRQLRPTAVPSVNLPDPPAAGGFWNVDLGLDLGADIEMPDASQQEDDPLQIGEEIAEPERGEAHGGDAVFGDAISAPIGSGHGDAQAQAPPKASEKGIQTEMPGRNKATQTQKRSRDRAVQTKEQLSEREKLRAEEQRIVAFQKEVRSLKVRYMSTYHLPNTVDIA